MKQKTFQHKTIEECNLCSKDINTEKEKWVTLIDYDCNKLANAKFYHLNCIVNLIEEKSRIIEEKFKEKLKKFLKPFASYLQGFDLEKLGVDEEGKAFIKI